nr:UvrD-helicase domain-containing protein [uncultured Arsenicibacter sp.]
MFKIYSSSAGSGKTYTLTREYLKLALKPENSERYFSQILAITFTNAASNEMKNRILERLEDMAEGKELPLIDDLTTELFGVETGSDAFDVAKKRLRTRAHNVYRTILHDYSNFSVTTIDSFTQRIVTAFTDELGLPYSFEVEMDTDEVLALAVDNLIEKAGADEMHEVTDILTQYYRETAAEGENWNQLPVLLQEFGRNLTSDQLYEAILAIQELTPAAIKAMRRKMLDFRQKMEDDIVVHGRRAWTIICDQHLSESDFSQGSKGIGGYFRAIAEGDAYKSVNSYHTKAIQEGAWYTKKAPKHVQAMIDGMADQLCDCFAAIETIREERMSLAMLYDGIMPHLYKIALLKQLRTEFDELLRKDGRVHISEFNKKILNIVATEPVPFLYERLGAKYNHILIDEFQDTSKLQFANLLPLIDNALGFGHFNLAVGDGKQAIYRFRGGDMDQIVALHRNDLDTLKQAHSPTSFTAERIDSLHGNLHSEILGTNWRSAKPIVTFNNQLFEYVARRFEGDHLKIADVFDREQLFHQLHSPKAREEGHVQIDFVSKEDGDESADLTSVMLAKTLEHLNQALADGYQYGDIAILCRKKDQAKALANELNALKIPLVSADSLSLQYADSVRLIVTLMQVLIRPDLKLLRYELLYLYCRVVRAIQPDDTQTAELRTLAESHDDTLVYNYFREYGHSLNPHALRQLNAYELAEKLIYLFGLYDRESEAPFLFRFLDEVLTFGHKQSGHLADFLLYWESVQHKVSVGEGAQTNAVSIQTIHKSKGLEYPVVIIPFANWEVAPRGDLWLTLSSLKADPLRHSLPTGETIRLRHAPARLRSEALAKLPQSIRSQHEEETTRVFLENMNLLYVAFTRPTDRLYIIAQQKDFSKQMAQKSVSYWLHAFLLSDEAKACGCGWSEGRSTYILSACPDAYPKKQTTKDESVIWIEAVTSGDRAQNMQLRRQAERLFDTRTFERTHDRDRKLVAALSLLKSAAGIDPILRQLISEGLIRTAESNDIRQRLTAIVSHPDLAPLFDPALRVDTDRSILNRKRLHSAPHRVVHRPDGSIVLVQFQSAPNMAAQDSQSLRYFTNLYREMGYNEVEGRLVYLTEQPKVVPV